MILFSKDTSKTKNDSDPDDFYEFKEPSNDESNQTNERKNTDFFERTFETAVFVKYCEDRHGDADLPFSGKDKDDLAACRFCLDYEIQL